MGPPFPIFEYEVFRMHDIIVIGAGPAGLTAALYAARAGKSVLVLEQAGFGGQIALSPRVENYPGIPHMAGSLLADALVEQVLSQGVDVDLETVTGFSGENGDFTVTTEDGQHSCRAIVLATGLTHRHLGLEDEEALVGRGVSYCAVCDGAFYNDRCVAVVGGGDTALQDALFLAATCKKVTLIHRRDQFRGEEALVKKLQALDNVEILRSHMPVALESQNGELCSVRLRDLKAEQEFSLPVDGLFLAVGQQPHNGQFAEQVRLTDAGFVDAGEDCRTNIPGVFVAGDCRTKEVRQLTTAVGDGAVAALAACRYVDAH